MTPTFSDDSILAAQDLLPPGPWRSHKAEDAAVTLRSRDVGIRVEVLEGGDDLADHRADKATGYSAAAMPAVEAPSRST